MQCVIIITPVHHCLLLLLLLLLLFCRRPLQHSKQPAHNDDASQRSICRAVG
jgi:hypothetical protein